SYFMKIQNVTSAPTIHHSTTSTNGPNAGCQIKWERSAAPGRTEGTTQGHQLFKLRSGLLFKLPYKTPNNPARTIIPPPRIARSFVPVSSRGRGARATP